MTGTGGARELSAPFGAAPKRHGEHDESHQDHKQPESQHHRVDSAADDACLDLARAAIGGRSGHQVALIAIALDGLVGVAGVPHGQRGVFHRHSVDNGRCLRQDRCRGFRRDDLSGGQVPDLPDAIHDRALARVGDRHGAQAFAAQVFHHNTGGPSWAIVACRDQEVDGLARDDDIAAEDLVDLQLVTRGHDAVVITSVSVELDLGVDLAGLGRNRSDVREVEDDAVSSRVRA